MRAKFIFFKEILHLLLLPIFLISCVSTGDRIRYQQSPVEDYRDATNEIERIRENLVDAKPEDPFRSMNLRQLNWALERQASAVDKRFSALEGKERTEPVAKPMRWTVKRMDGHLGFAVNPGDAPVDGLWTQWSEEGGRKQTEFTTKGGLKTGKQVSFHPNGKKKEEVPYDQGKRHGMSTGWNADGNKIWERSYKNDQLSGDWIRYGKDGEVIGRTTYLNGRSISEE